LETRIRLLKNADEHFQEKNPIAVTTSAEDLIPIELMLLSGLLITFVQFVITALFTWPNHFSISHPPSFVKPRAVPLIRWLPNILMFFLVNMLNNFAFGYNISVPVHIILRSGGSIMTMAVGYVWGTRYTKVQGQ